MEVFIRFFFMGVLVDSDGDDSEIKSNDECSLGVVCKLFFLSSKCCDAEFDGDDKLLILSSD